MNEDAVKSRHQNRLRRRVGCLSVFAAIVTILLIPVTRHEFLILVGVRDRFGSIEWIEEDHQQRYKMLHDLYRKHSLTGMDRSEIFTLLGSPSDVNAYNSPDDSPDRTGIPENGEIDYEVEAPSGESFFSGYPHLRLVFVDGVVARYHWYG